jgi:hypothetical protein
LYVIFYAKYPVIYGKAVHASKSEIKLKKSLSR